MIPPDWEPFRRDEDGELVGYLVTTDDLVTPMSLLGTALDTSADRFTAEQVLAATGLSYLADQWILRQPDGTEQRVVIVELDAARAVVTPADFALVVGRPTDEGDAIEIAIPTDRLIRR